MDASGHKSLCGKEWQTQKKPLGALRVATESLFGGQICAEKLGAGMKAFELCTVFSTVSLPRQGSVPPSLCQVFLAVVAGLLF